MISQINLLLCEHNESLSTLKLGINVPKNDSDWLTANKYFKLTLQPNSPNSSQDLNSKIIHMNETMYTYFAENWDVCHWHKPS